MKNVGVFAPVWETLQELADSKKAMIFLLGIVGIANAEAVGFEGVPAKYRLAAAVALGAVWIVSQAVVDTWGTKASKPDQPVK